MKTVDEKEELKNKYIKLVKRSGLFKKSVALTDSFYDSLYTVTFGRLKLGDVLKEANDFDCESFYSLLFARVLKKGEYVNGNLKTIKSSSKNCLNRSWVEFGNMVYDITLKRVFYKSYFYRVFKPEIVESYSSIKLLKADTCIDIALKSLEPDSEKLIPIFARAFFNMIDKNSNNYEFNSIIENYNNKHPKEQEMIKQEMELHKKEMKAKMNLFSEKFEN